MPAITARLTLDERSELRSSRRMESASLYMAGLTLVFVAAGMVVSAVADLTQGGAAWRELLLAALATAVPGVVAWRTTRVPARLTPSGVFAAVTMSWIAMIAFGALPYVFDGALPRFDDALFESASGYTCTGSSVVQDIGALEPGIAFYRMLTQWVGGMGVIVLAVAVLPFLGVGGLDLVAAEAPGDTTDRLAPRVSETAKRLWIIYALLTVVIATALWIAGTSLFNAIGYSFAIAATGGFALSGTGTGVYDSVPVEVIFIVGMLLGGMNFTLHYRLLRGDPGSYWRSSEWRAYMGFALLASTTVVLVNVVDGMAVADALRDGPFNVVSLMTTTGVGNLRGGAIGDFVQWAPAAQFVLLAVMLVGGMTGSTSGGPKVLRIVMMGRVVRREVRRAQHPRAVIAVEHDASTVPESIVERIVGFCLLYFLLAVGGLLLVAPLGDVDIVTAVTGVVSSLGNVGPALGDAGPTSTYLVFSAPARMVLAFLMLAGRLELFALFLGLATPVRWLRRRL